MRGAPVHPDDYDGEHLNTDAKLEAAGWAAGLDVWEPVGTHYAAALRDGILANAQLWSLRCAIRREFAQELLDVGVVDDTDNGQAVMELADGRGL